MTASDPKRTITPAALIYFSLIYLADAKGRTECTRFWQHEALRNSFPFKTC